MGAFIGRNLHYPPGARHAGKEGTVFVVFIINADGTIDKESVTVLKSVYPSLDEEAIRIVKISPPWVPGMHSGRPVQCRFVLPIKFKLG